MKTLYIGIGIIFLLCGIYTYQQVAAEQEAKDHCATVNALVISEFDAIVAKGKFPTQEQQDHWVVLTRGCEESK